MIYKSSVVSEDEQRVFARISAALEGLDAEIDRLVTGQKSAAFPKPREDLLVASARQEAYTLLRAALSDLISDAAVGAVLEEAAAVGLTIGEERTRFVEDVKRAVSFSQGGKLDQYGIVDEVTKLRIGFFWVDRSRYADMVPPHLREKSTDILLVG
jgi:hypothetical protein